MLEDSMIVDRLFVDQPVHIKAGQVYSGCTFDGCIMILNSLDHIHLHSCHMQYCTFVGMGWPDFIKRNEPWRAEL